MNNWKEVDGKLVREFICKDFSQAFLFLTLVAKLSEQHSHHPEILNIYNRVTLRLCTHDKKNSITQKDFHLANAIDVAFASIHAEGGDI